MGGARATPCSHGMPIEVASKANAVDQWYEDYCKEGLCHEKDRVSSDPAATYLPLVYQHHDATSGALNTTVLEQPLDFTTLASKYEKFAIY